VTGRPAATDRRRLRRLEWLLLAASLLGFAWFHPGGGWNQNVRFALVRAIVEEGRVAVDSFLVYEADPAPGASRLVRSPIVDGEVVLRGQRIALYWRDGDGRPIPLTRRVAGQVVGVRNAEAVVEVAATEGVTFDIRVPPETRVLRQGQPIPLASLAIGEPVLVTLDAPDGRRAMAGTVEAGVASAPSPAASPRAATSPSTTATSTRPRLPAARSWRCPPTLPCARWGGPPAPIRTTGGPSP
jgi:hypothetical protein